jgi:hypothetical protein
MRMMDYWEPPFFNCARVALGINFYKTKYCWTAWRNLSTWLPSAAARFAGDNSCTFRIDGLTYKVDYDFGREGVRDLGRRNVFSLSEKCPLFVRQRSFCKQCSSCQTALFLSDSSLFVRQRSFCQTALFLSDSALFVWTIKWLEMLSAEKAFCKNCYCIRTDIWIRKCLFRKFYCFLLSAVYVINCYLLLISQQRQKNALQESGISENAICFKICFTRKCYQMLSLSEYDITHVNRENPRSTLKCLNKKQCLIGIVQRDLTDLSGINP